MKILWIGPNFLHPTTKGGQIRTLETLRQLNRRHELHYAAFENPAEPEGLARSGEYCSRAFPFRLHVPTKTSPAFLPQLVRGLFDAVPVAIRRYHSAEMARFTGEQIGLRAYDCLVCDFLAVACNFPSLSNAVLFQHNVETIIWRRRAEQARNPLSRLYLDMQARRMFAFERDACRQAQSVIAVSDTDAGRMRDLFGVDRVAAVPTGVDLDYFAPPNPPPPAEGLVFVGSMDWLPNIDGIVFFVREVLPLIRNRCPGCRLTVVGRTPPPAVRALGETDPLITVTGTVPDVRPYLWGAAAAIVPLRIGGGTRLKIYEAMAARVPVVSTAIGAEGLPLTPGEHVLIGDAPRELAEACIDLIESRERRSSIATAAWRLVSSQFGWEPVAARFEQLLASSVQLRRR